MHERRTDRYDEADQAWTRQDAVVTAMRTNLDLGPGDDPDRGAGQTQIEEQAAVATTLRNHLNEIASALDRSDNGTYGVCVRCGGDAAAAESAATLTEELGARLTVTQRSWGMPA